MQVSRHISIVLFMLFVCASLTAQTRKWSFAATIPEVNLNHTQLIFADSIHGYFLGWKRLKTSNPTYEDAVLYRTIDGGISWQNIDFHTILGPDTTFYGINSSNSAYLRFDVASSKSCVISNSEFSNQIKDPLTFYWSENNGSSWFPTRASPKMIRSDLLIESAPHAHQIVALSMNKNLPGITGFGQFAVSATNGAIFDDIRWDSTLLKNIMDPYFPPNIDDHTFDYFDDTTWIVTVSDRYNSYSPNLKKPYSLVTLLAKDLDFDSDPGTYWEVYPNNIPDFPSDYHAKYFDMHCLRGTEYVYMFSGYGGQGQYPFYGINYLYSSDKGRSWNADSSFVINSESHRRAITASAPSEVWSTLIPLYSIIYLNSPATWIAHSTDFGKNWSIDSSSLLVKEIQQYDGRAITFSDKNHGWMYAQSIDNKNSAIFRYDATPDEVNTMPKENTTSFTLYPNPVGNEATIRSSNNLPVTSLDIYDILGRKCSCKYEIKTGQSSVIFRTNELPPGSYLARIRDSNGIDVIPFVVQH